MFGFSFLIFYGVLSLVNISSAEDPPWSCSFGSFDQSVRKQYGPCIICPRKEFQPSYWFVTDKAKSFGETQPYFRAALNNPNNGEGVSAECTLLNASLPSGGVLWFRYIFNSPSPNKRIGYFNYSVCKGEGTVHPLHVVEGWVWRHHSFNCTDIEISFRAVRGESYTNVGIDDVDVVLPEVSLQSTSSSGNIQTLSATTHTTEVLSTIGETKLQTVQVIEQTGTTSPQEKTEEPFPRYILYVASSVAATCLLLAVIITIFLCRKCRSRSKPVSSQESDVDDAGLVINELYDEWSALPSASDILVDGDHAHSSSTTTPDTIGTNVDNDMGNIAGDGHGGWARRSAHYKTTCDDITYHTLEAPTEDDCTIYQGQENTYADIEDDRFGVSNVDDDLKDTKGDGSCKLACRSTQEKTSCDGNTYYTLEAPPKDSSADIEKDRNDKAWRSMSDKTTCQLNTYYTLEIPSKDDERHGEVSDNEYEDVDRVNFPGQEDAGVNKRFTLERRFLSPDAAGTSSNKQQQNGNKNIRLSKDEDYDALNFRTSVKKSSGHNANGAIAEETGNIMYGSLNVPETSDPPTSPDNHLINDHVYGNLSDVHVDSGKCQEEKLIASRVEPEAMYQNMEL